MIDDLFAATLGLLVYSKEKAEEFIEILVDKGEMKQDEARKLVNRLAEKGKQEKERYSAEFQKTARNLESKLKEKFVTREDLQRLEGKLDQLVALVKDKLS